MAALVRNLVRERMKMKSGKETIWRSYLTLEKKKGGLMNICMNTKASGTIL